MAPGLAAAFLLLGLLAGTGGPARAGELSPDLPPDALVWRFPDQARPSPDLVRYRACLDRGQGAAPCLRGLMTARGASAQALALSRLAGGECFASEALPVGGLVLVTLVHPARANANEVPALYGGRPALVSTEIPLEGLGLDRSPELAALRGRFPEAEVWTVDPGFLDREDRPGGGERFLFAYPVLNGCHACEQVGRAVVALEFDRSRTYLGPRLVRVEPGP